MTEFSPKDRAAKLDGTSKGRRYQRLSAEFEGDAFLSRNRRGFYIYVALACVVCVLFAFKFDRAFGAETIAVKVENSGFLNLDLRIVDGFCQERVFNGRITGLSEIIVLACSNEGREVDLIVIELLRGQSFRLKGVPRTLKLKQGSG